jgi:hypothetical protein
MRMKLRPGQKLHSAVSDAQVVVIRAPETEVDVGCGGVPMLGDGEAPAAAAELDPSLGDGPELGKRYADDDLGLELLCSRGGEGALTVDGHLLLLKGAKPLPSSD